MDYDPSRAAAFFDGYGEREWARFEDGRSSSLSLAIHRHYVAGYVHPGDRVLDVGAGPGRFTLQLAELGARVTVADISAEQLRLNHQRLSDASLADHIERWVQADIVDLSAFPDADFDAVVCYGGPLSYVMDRADTAVAELMRVLRPGGTLLLSVMSLVGSTAASLQVVLDEMRRFGTDVIGSVITTGDLPSSLGGHLEMHMYRWRELQALLRRHSAEVVAASSSGLAFGRLHAEALDALTAEEFGLVTEWAIDLAAEPGAIDMGEHIIAVARKP